MSSVAIENALMNAVRTASGITAARWAMQGAARQEPGPFLSLQLDGPSAVGLDYVRSETDLTQANGAEIGLNAGGLRELRLTVTCFDAKFVETGETTATMTARAILANVQSGIRLPTAQAYLLAAGLGLFDVGPVQDIGALLGPRFESRAQIILRLYYSHERTERIGYIASVEVTSTPE